MIKLNDKNIIVGQIKQILTNFNLPQCYISDEHTHNGQHFIKESELFYCEGNKDKAIEHYEYNRPYLNLTTTLPISNIIYDRPTHRYLGKYLRFLKKYKHMDLMSLYNCFDGLVSNRNVAFNVNNDVILFGSIDSSSVVYSIPVTLDELYTVYVDSDRAIDMCVTLDVDINSLNNTLLKELSSKTYVKRLCNQRLLFDKLVNLDMSDALSKLISESHNQLVLLVKVPKSYNKSIVVLEGNFITDYTHSINHKNFIYKPYVETNGEFKPSENVEINTNITNPQLLSYLNANDNYLISDKLIEYLTGNAISQLSKYYDIEKLQKQLIKQDLPSAKYLGIWSHNENVSLAKLICKFDLHTKYDMLPYLDKEIENKFKGDMI